MVVTPSELVETTVELGVEVDSEKLPVLFAVDPVKLKVDEGPVPVGPTSKEVVFRLEEEAY